MMLFVERCKGSLDKKGFAGAVFVDFSKASDGFNRELLIAKRDAYGFSKSALKLIFSYLDKQKTKG